MLEVGLIRRRTPCQKDVARGVTVVTVIGVVVDHLVVVPHQHPRMRRMRGLQPGVALVLRVALAVSVQRHRLRAIVATDQETRIGAFVDVVTDKQHEVQRLLGDVSMGHVLALLIVLARSQRQSQALHDCIHRGRRTCVPHRTGGVTASEAIPIVTACWQITQGHMHTVRARGIGDDFALSNQLTQGLIGKQFPPHRHRFGGLMGQRRRGLPIRVIDDQASPQHHTIRTRGAAGHPQGKRGRLPAPRDILWLRHGQRPGCQCQRQRLTLPLTPSGGNHVSAPGCRRSESRRRPDTHPRHTAQRTDRA